MKYNIKKLLTNFLSLQVYLLLTGAILSFSASRADEMLQEQAGGYFTIPPVEHELAQSGTAVFFKVLNGHKATCQRICSGKVKSLSACLTGIYRYNARYIRVIAGNTFSFLSWIRPGYYIFLFIYALF